MKCDYTLQISLENDSFVYSFGYGSDVFPLFLSTPLDISSVGTQQVKLAI